MAALSEGQLSQVMQARDWMLRETTRGNLQGGGGFGGLVMKAAPLVMGAVSGVGLTGLPALMAGGLAGAAQQGVASGGDPLSMIGGALSGAAASYGTGKLIGGGGGFTNPAGLGTGSSSGLGVNAAHLYNPAALGGAQAASTGLGLNAGMLYTPAAFGGAASGGSLISRAVDALRGSGGDSTAGKAISAASGVKTAVDVGRDLLGLATPALAAGAAVAAARPGATPQPQSLAPITNLGGTSDPAGTVALGGAREAERKRAAAASGASDTIVTSSLGLTGEARGRRKRVLGG